jgi:probable rRNA maturation factor
MSELGYKGSHLAVLFTDDEGVRSLNRDFRGLDRPTNVLAFPDTDAAKGLSGHLGDVALSMETLEREAEASGAPLGWQMYYYLLHAILHLAGYDHEKGPAADRAQRSETERLMALIRHDL